MTTFLSSTAREALQKIHYAAEVNRLFLTRDELASGVYREVKEVCARLGGRWNTASQSFLFSSDPTAAISVVRESGEMPPKNPYAFFQTPDAISEHMLLYGFGLFRCNLCEGYRHGQPLHSCQYLPANLRILEPSAGQGAIARWVRQLYASLGRDDYTLHCCELNPINQMLLRKQGFQLVASNFLDYHLADDEPFYDVILINPPFQGHEYIDHIEHAWSMLNPREGRLVAVTSTGFTWHDDAPCRRLYSLVCRYRDDTPTISPAGLFKESGTPVKTMLLPLVKRDLSWKDRPYEGYPDWHCYMLDFFLNQTKSLSDQRWAIWKRLENGELSDDPEQPGWEQTRALLSTLFAQAAQQAWKEWVEIRLDEREQQLMEHVFLEHGLTECQCERHTALRQQWFNQRADAGSLPIASLVSGSVEDGSTLSQICSNARADPSLPSLPAPAECVQLALFPA